MKYIQLPSGHQVKVDDEDFLELSKYRWHQANGYAMRHISSKPDKRIYMHRQILNTPEGLVTDHINGDKLDNRKENLRAATIVQNSGNSKKRAGLSEYKGVSFFKPRGYWRARITIDGRCTLIGYFRSQEEAHKAYCIAADKVFGAYARYK